MTRIITAELLERHGACEEQVDLFREDFPKGSPKTRKAAMAAALRHADKFYWKWAACNLLSAPAWRAYEEAIAPAWRAYQEARAPAWRAYEEAIAPARRAYEEAIAPAWRAYKEATAAAFVDAWFDQENEE